MSNPQANPITFDGDKIHWQDIVQVARHHARLVLSSAVETRLENARSIVEQIVAKGERAYGISTGLGALCNTLIDREQQATLSNRVLLSHACGVGDMLPVEQTRAIMATAVANFSQGHSGISPHIVALIVSFLNAGITPQVPKQGSVGYLTHMAHIAITLVGVGNVHFEGQVIPASEGLKRCHLEPAQLGAKDGLSLVNGTPCMTGLASLALDDCNRLAQWADLTGAMSFEAQGGQLNAFDEDVLNLKPYAGLITVGSNLRTLLKDSEVIKNREGQRTQDALSIRSIPQIHGACRDQIDHAARQINTELNSATDNPLVLGTPDNYRVVSQANPHGEAIAMACDQLAIAVLELSSVAERRMDRLINPLVSGLPPFLVEHSGVNSGMMIAQYVAASLVSENRRLAQPAVADNFVTSALQEDHLSMGTTAALKLHESLANSFRVIAIEYLFASQAFEFFEGEQFGIGTHQAWQWLRQHIAPYHEDRWLSPEIELSASLIRSHRVSEILTDISGEIQ